MKISLLFAVSLALAASSVAPADARDRPTSRVAVSTAASAGPGCTGGVWPAFAACKNVYNFKDYGDCHGRSIQMGWRTNDIWWYCSSLSFQN